MPSLALPVAAPAISSNTNPYLSWYRTNTNDASHSESESCPPYRTLPLSPLTNRRRFSTNTSIGSAPSALGSPVDPTKGGSSVPLVLTTTEANPVAGEGSQLDFHPVGSTPGEAPESSLQVLIITLING